MQVHERPELRADVGIVDTISEVRHEGTKILASKQLTAHVPSLKRAVRDGLAAKFDKSEMSRIGLDASISEVKLLARTFQHLEEAPAADHQQATQTVSAVVAV